MKNFLPLFIALATLLCLSLFFSCVSDIEPPPQSQLSSSSASDGNDCDVEAIDVRIKGINDIIDSTCRANQPTNVNACIKQVTAYSDGTDRDPSLPPLTDDLAIEEGRPLWILNKQKSECLR